MAVDLEDKTCELRKADRDFKRGDYLMLVEFDPQRDRLTGRYLCRQITHIITGDQPPRGLVDGFVILSIATCDRYDTEALLGQGNSVLGAVEWVKP